MKRLYAIVLAVVMLFAINVTAYGRDPIVSPEGEKTEESGDTSPKTADLSVLTIGMTSVVLAATGIAASKKVRG